MMKMTTTRTIATFPLVYDDDDENDRDVTINMWWDGRRQRGQGMGGKGGGERRGRGEDDGLRGPRLHGGRWYDDSEGWHGETGARGGTARQ